MSISDKLILTDVDGVLCDWSYSFEGWLNRHGHAKRNHNSDSYSLEDIYNLNQHEVMKLIRMFNESASIGYLPPVRDSIKYVRKLHEEHGYIFHCITSLSSEDDSKKLRISNLNKLFGETVFEKVVCLDTCADKTEALKPYENSMCWWIEDKVSNALDGVELGLRSILLSHDHNKIVQNNPPKNLIDHVTRVSTWKEVYNLITD